MRLEDQRQSDNVEDMRGVRSRTFGGRSIGIGSIAIALVASYFLGVDPMMVLGVLGGGQGSVEQSREPGPRPPPTDEKAVFVARVLGSTEDTWGTIFDEAGSRYDAPKLDLFTGSFPTACGMGQAAAGPFYCPGDRKIYIDLGFYQLMRDRFHASGDFAEAYVIAHEVGHHVQNLLGISEKVQSMRQRIPEGKYNALSVRLELQADCFAGVWANRADQSNRMLEPGDVESAVTAAAAIGDDTLQKQSQGYAVPDSFTHGSSAQRVRWLKQGLASGELKTCDTFAAQQL